MAKLIIIEGAGIGTEYDLGSGGGPRSFMAGRDDGLEIQLPDGAVSRRHFRIERSPGGWRAIDLGSRNQTFRNGDSVKDEVLRHGDILRAGDTELRFEDAGESVQITGGPSTILKEIPAFRELAKGTQGLETPSAGDGEPRPGLAEAKRSIELFGRIARRGTPLELILALLRELATALSADRAAVLLREGEPPGARPGEPAGARALEEEGGWVVHASWSEGPGGSGPPLQVSTSIVRKVAHERKAILSRDTHVDDRFRTKDSIVLQEIVSAIAAPIIVGGRSSGVLYADRRGAKPPFGDEDLELLLAGAGPCGALLERQGDEEEMRKENRNLIRSIAQTKRIIGRSSAVAQVLEFIRRAAPTPMTVLIAGETGTGKELVASAIHYASPRRGQPFVAINCAALPENLVESELFGHERGAFTGAVTRKKGRFELADRGTVLLDEVGELSLPCQAKLLRLLEEREFERVGGVESIKVDVRVIAATNRNLLDAVAAGKFREDLYYRLGVLQVELPPLRERRDDVLLLAEHFLSDSCGGLKKLAKSAEKKLIEYRWPGNVRQLRNVIESAVVLGEGAEIQPEDLVLPEPRGRAAAGEEPRGPGGARDPAWEPVSLEELERLHIRKVLAHTGGNKKRAAEILGIERCTLYAKIKGYGM